MKESATYKPNLSFGLLLCGLPGTGKTTGILNSFPNCYVADCDNNLSSAARRMEKEKRGFFYDTINLSDDNKEVPDTERWPRLVDKVRLAATDPKVGTIFIDSLTMVSDYLIWWILKQQNRTDGKMQIQDWGTLREKMAKFVTGCRCYGKPVIFSAHEKYDKDEATGRMKFLVNWPGQFADQMPAYFSDFWQAQAKVVGDKVTYIVRTTPTSQFALKNSLNLPTELELTQENISKYLGTLHEQTK